MISTQVFISVSFWAARATTCHAWSAVVQYAWASAWSGVSVARAVPSMRASVRRSLADAIEV
jgi:hypothetical protein